MELPMLDSALDKLQKDGYYETNPYWERWGKGRPSKEKIAKRKLSDQWQQDYRKKHPEETPMMSFLLDGKILPAPKKHGEKIMIKYISRS